MLAVRDGDYVPQGDSLRTVEGDEALLQRLLLKLTARRGKFPFMEDFGSRLWTLGQLRPSERQAAAEQYVTEALAEEELTVERVTLTETGGGTAAVTVEVRLRDRLLMLEVTPR